MVYPRSHRLAQAALILNPTSGRNQKEAPKVLALANQAGLTWALVKTFAEIERETLRLLETGKRHLLVSGGDGTVSGVLTVCLRAGEKPLVSVLPGGTTNLIAWDVSRPSGQLKILENFLTGAPGVFLTRRLVRVKPKEVYGLFGGAGLIAQGVARYNERRVKEGLLGLRNALPVALRLLKEGAPGAKLKARSFFEAAAVLVTTLERVFLPVAPFLQKPCPSLKVGLFPRRLFPFKVLCLPRLELLSPLFALDGEILRAEDGFVIETTEEITFARW